MNFAFLPQYVPDLLRGTETTLALSILSLIVAGALGTVIAITRILVGRWPDRAIGLIVDLIRATPLLVQILLWYLGSSALGIPISVFPAAVLAVSVNYAAFISEAVRGAVLGVPRGQREAAVSLGVSPLYSVVAIELPQALPAIVPAVVGLFIGLVKDTSFAYILGLLELTRTGEFISNQSYRPIETFLVVALIYFVICFPISRLGRHLDQRMRRSGMAEERLFV